MDLRNATLIAESVRAGRHTAREAVDAALESIDKVNGELSAYLSVDPGNARSRAEAVDRAVAEGGRLPLAGVPVAVKDNICTKGVRTTCGSRILGDFVPPYSATAVERLERAGAIVVGKTNCDEFAMGSSTENSAFGVTRNPHDPTRVPGGSSGGSAAAVAAGTVPLALGSDTGGSVRQPASFCGVIGLKPTYGRISRFGLVAFASSLDVIGVLANSAADAALLLAAVAGHDEKDATSAVAPVPEYRAGLSTPLRGLRIGIPREFFADGLDPEVGGIIDGAVRDACNLGCEAVEVSLPHTPYAIADYYIIAPAEASSNLARYDGVRYGYRAPRVRELQEMYTDSRSMGFGPEVRRRIMVGTYALSAGYYEAYYGRAMKVRTLIRRDYDEALAKVDVLFAPVSPTAAFGIGEKAADPLAMYLSDIYTVTANLAGIPGISIPAGMTAAGLPVGLQVLGRALDEQTLLRVAHHLMPAAPTS